MDAYAVSQALGYAVASLKGGGACLQSRFRDAKNMRYVHTATHTLSALSYIFLKNPFNAAAYGTAALRGAVRSTSWGTEHKTLVCVSSAAAMTCATVLLYKRPADLMPLAAIFAGSVMDYHSQGRYRRAVIFGSTLGAWIPAAALSKNWAMLVAEITSAVVFGQAIYRYDLKNAAGEGKSLSQNLKAYFYGIVFGAATGASKEGQVSTDTGAEDIYEQYERLKEERPNPYFQPK